MKNCLIICTNSDLAGAPLYSLKVLEILHKKLNFFTLYGTKITNKYTQKKIKYFSKHYYFSEKLSNEFNLIYDFKLILFIIKLVKRNNIKYLYLHSFKAAFLGRIASLFVNSKVIYVVHGWGWRGKNIIQRTIVYLSELILSRYTDKYVFLSDYSSKIGENILQIDRKKTTKIFSTISFDKFNDFDIKNYRESKKDNNINILMIARNDASKDHKTLLKAFKNLPNKYNLQLIGKDTEEILNINKKFIPDDIFHRIKTFGEINNVKEFLLNADIFVLSSHFEELPLSLIEALYFGLPVLASDVGGCKEIIKHKKNGFLFKKGDHIELRKYLLNLYEKEKRLEFSKNSLRVFDEKFSELNFRKEIQKLFIEI